MCVDRITIFSFAKSDMRLRKRTRSLGAHGCIVRQGTVRAEMSARDSRSGHDAYCVYKGCDKGNLCGTAGGGGRPFQGGYGNQPVGGRAQNFPGGTGDIFGLLCYTGHWSWGSAEQEEKAALKPVVFRTKDSG